MTFGDTLRLALNNLRESKLRTALTSLGVSIGIASLIGMVSLGVGLQEQLLGRFMESGVFDAITVSASPGGAAASLLGGRGRAVGGRGVGRGARVGRGGRGGRGAESGAGPRPVLDDEAMAKLRALPNVKDVFPSVRLSVQLRVGAFDSAGGAVGIPMSAKDEGAFRTMTAGAFFANEAEETCLLSLDMAKRIVTEQGADAEPASLVGQILTISYSASLPGNGAAPSPATKAPAAMPGLGFAGMPSLAGVTSMLQVQRVERPFRIAGIVEREPGANLGGFGFASVMIPLARAIDIDAHVVQSLQDLLASTPAAGKAKSYTSVTVKVAKAQYVQDVEAQIKEMGYGAFSLNDALEGAKRAFILIDILLSLIGSIALAVSSLGIVNTMVMSILERTREIGVMKAIGASDADIRRIFLVEASAIGVLGGVAGLALGWMVARAINIGANIYIERQGGDAGNLFSFPLWLTFGALGFSWLVSLVAGSVPARRAARLNPIQALRHD